MNRKPSRKILRFCVTLVATSLFLCFLSPFLSPFFCRISRGRRISELLNVPRDDMEVIRYKQDSALSLIFGFDWHFSWQVVLSPKGMEKALSRAKPVHYEDKNLNFYDSMSHDFGVTSNAMSPPVMWLPSAEGRELWIMRGTKNNEIYVHYWSN